MFGRRLTGVGFGLCGGQKVLKAKGIDTMLAETRKNSKDLDMDMDIGQGR